MNYPEENTKKLQKTLQNIEKTLKSGDFYIETLEENLINKKLSEISPEDLERNLITLNITLTLKKLPGKELETNTSNLVNSTIIGGGNEGINPKNDIIGVLNDFMASKVNFVINDILKKSEMNKKHFENLKEELLNELILDDRLKEDINGHMLKLMESNLNNMSMFNEKMKKSVLNADPDEFNHVINNYFQSKIDFIFLNTKNSLIKEVHKKNPDVSQILLDNYINTKIKQKNEIIKSQIISHIQKNDNNDLNNIKKSVINNLDDEEKINQVVNDYLKSTLGKLKEEDYEVKDDKDELPEDLKIMIDGFLDELIKKNFEGGN